MLDAKLRSKARVEKKKEGVKFKNLYWLPERNSVTSTRFYFTNLFGVMAFNSGAVPNITTVPGTSETTIFTISGFCCKGGSSEY